MTISHIYLRVICLNNYRLKIILSLLAAAGFTVTFFLNPAAVIAGVSKGLSLCATAVIPPLFPFVILSDFLIRSGLCDISGAYLNFITKPLFKLPGSAGCAVLMSLVGGYPVGAKMIAQLTESGSISEKQGRRMLLFCVNAGPAFVIGTVGTVMLSSKKAGVLLYASMVLSALVMGFILRFFSDEAVAEMNLKAEFKPSVITESVTAGTNAMLSMCAWVLVFSCVNSLLKTLPLKGNTQVWLNILTEVTSGCVAASKVFPVSVQSLVMGWAGLSVHCQIFGFVKATKLKLSWFLISRLVHAGLATAVAGVLFKVFPCEVSVFSSMSQILPRAFSVSAPAAVAMLCLCAFLILDILPSRGECKIKLLH